MMMQLGELGEQATPERERCLHCHGAIQRGGLIRGVDFLDDEWRHWHGDRYCHDQHGYCATPLRAAQPPFHPADAVL